MRDIIREAIEIADHAENDGAGYRLDIYTVSGMRFPVVVTGTGAGGGSYRLKAVDFGGSSSNDIIVNPAAVASVEIVFL